MTTPLYTMLLPVGTALFSIVARNPIHAILWLISTFLLTCGLLLHYFKLGFTPALIIVVYIGAIAVLFIFIIMLIPIKERVVLARGWKRSFGQFVAFLTVYLGAGCLLAKHLLDKALVENGAFWARFVNQLDHQTVLPHLPHSETGSPSVTDLRLDDIAIYGAKLYSEFAFPIIMTALLLLFVLVAAIVLCKED